MTFSFLISCIKEFETGGVSKGNHSFGLISDGFTYDQSINQLFWKDVGVLVHLLPSDVKFINFSLHCFGNKGVFSIKLPSMSEIKSN